MATSPPPPFPSSLPASKKRPSISSQASLQGASKKPRLHPLRQTSFPVDGQIPTYGSAVTSARSETGSISNSLLSAGSSKRPRGRPKKSIQLQPEDIQASQTPDDSSRHLNPGPGTGRSEGAGGARSVVSAKSGPGDAGDDEDEGEEVAAILNDEEIDQEKRADERQHQLMQTFDVDQAGRYEAWRRVKLNTGTLKKLVNQTVSQSVSASPLAALNHFTKYFIGEIVERARDVQVEYARAYDETREVERNWRREELRRLEERQKNGLEDDANRLLARDLVRLRREVDEYIPNPHRGGLLPDHLREALRRYRADGEGGGVGTEGLSHGLLGVVGSSVWRAGDGTVGKRLFR
jgi:transcription initiation factor TFIID subunit 11